MKSAILTILWIAGIILARGFWLTTLAVFVPFYGWYLVIAKVIHLLGWL